MVHLTLAKHKFFKTGNFEGHKEHQGMWEAYLSRPGQHSDNPACASQASQRLCTYLMQEGDRGACVAHTSITFHTAAFWQWVFSCSHSYALLFALFPSLLNIMRGQTTYPQLFCRLNLLYIFSLSEEPLAFLQLTGKKEVST